MKRSLKSSSWSGSVVGVGPAKRRSPLRVVALDGLERLVGDALVDQRGGGADQRVAALDVGVEEAERLAWLQRLQPQRDLGQLDRHRVHVDAVDAVLHHVPQRGAQRFDGGFRVVLAHRGQALGDAPGGRDQEVPGAARRVADGDRQQGVGDGDRRVGARVGRRHLGPFLRVVQDRVERGVQQAVDERGRRVVRAGALPLVAGASRRGGTRASPCSTSAPARGATRRSSRVPPRRGSGSPPAATAWRTCRIPGPAT